MASSQLKLYSYFRSSASYRVRIGLNLKGLDFEYRPVHLVKDGGEQFNDDYGKLNPSKELPTLVHGNHVLSQSMAILLYLDENFEGDKLFPSDSFQKNKVIQACEVINSGIQPLQNLRVLKKLVQDYGFSEEQKVGWIQHWINLGFESFETQIANTSGKYCFGDTPGAADAFLAPQVYNAERFDMNLSNFPNILKVHENYSKLEVFIKAHPSNQPDAQ